MKSSPTVPQEPANLSQVWTVQGESCNLGPGPGWTPRPQSPATTSSALGAGPVPTPARAQPDVTWKYGGLSRREGHPEAPTSTPGGRAGRGAGQRCSPNSCLLDLGPNGGPGPSGPLCSPQV